MLNAAQIRFLLGSIDNDNSAVPTREARLFIATCDELRAQLAELDKPAKLAEPAPAGSDTSPRGNVSPGPGNEAA